MHWNHPVQPFHTVVAVDCSVFNITYLHRAVVRQINILHIYYKYNRFSTACGSAHRWSIQKKHFWGRCAVPSASDRRIRVLQRYGVGNRSSLTRIHKKPLLQKDDWRGSANSESELVAR